jgi:hypothetical protein
MQFGLVCQNVFGTDWSLADRTCFCYGCILMVRNTAFNNISAILGRSDLLVKKTRVAGKNH